MMRKFLIAGWLAILCPLTPPSTPAWAQTVAGSFDDARRTEEKTPAAVHQDSLGSVLAQSQSQSPRKDPLWNGVIAGAAVGAMLGAFGGHVVFDCDLCSPGFNVPLTFGVVGAGVGAGIGAGIDAMRHRQTTAGGRFPGLVPIFGKARRGLMMWIRF
jgi:hypothetical protein